MKFPIISTIAVSLCAFAATVQADVKVASVNVAELCNKFHKRFEMEDRLKEQRTAIEADVKQREEKLRALQEADEAIKKKADPSMPESARRKLSEEHSAKLNEIQSYQQELQTYVQRRTVAFRELAQRELIVVLQDVQKSIEEVSNQKGLDLVVDGSAAAPTGTKVFPYVKSSFDITPEVLQLLNKTAPAGFDADAELQKRYGASAVPGAAPASK